MKERTMLKDRLEINIRPSMYLCTLLVLSHGLPILGILVSMLGIHYKVAFTFALTVSLIVNIHRHGLLTDPMSVLSVLYRDGSWFLGLQNGRNMLVSLDLPVFVASFLVVMNFKDGKGRSFPVAIFGDASAGEQMRHCRVFLKFHPNLGGTRMVSVASASKSG